MNTIITLVVTLLIFVIKLLGLKKYTYKLQRVLFVVNNVKVVNANEAFMEEAKEHLGNMSGYSNDLVEYTKENLLEMVEKQQKLLDERKALIKNL